MSFIVETVPTNAQDISTMLFGSVVELQHFIDTIRPADRKLVTELQPRMRCTCICNPVQNTGNEIKVEVYKCPGSKI